MGQRLALWVLSAVQMIQFTDTLSEVIFKPTSCRKSSLAQGVTLECKIYGDLPRKLNIKTPHPIPAWGSPLAGASASNAQAADPPFKKCISSFIFVLLTPRDCRVGWGVCGDTSATSVEKLKPPATL